MKSLTFLLVSTPFIFWVIACNRPEVGQGEFSLEAEPYMGSKLSLDGYYYYLDDDSEDYDLDRAIFFYRNGVILDITGATPPTSSLEELDETIREVENSRVQSSLFRWGIFQVESDTISFEKWYPSSGGYHPVYIRAGRILNDTTFVITESFRSDGTERRPKDETYHFRSFSPKPDSTNDFVP